jgi:hypothetical protein
MKSNREAKLKLLKDFGWKEDRAPGKCSAFKEDKAVQSLTTQASRFFPCRHRRCLH